MTCLNHRHLWKVWKEMNYYEGNVSQYTNKPQISQSFVVWHKYDILKIAILKVSLIHIFTDWEYHTHTHTQKTTYRLIHD